MTFLNLQRRQTTNDVEAILVCFHSSFFWTDESCDPIGRENSVLNAQLEYPLFERCDAIWCWQFHSDSACSARLIFGRPFGVLLLATWRNSDMYAVPDS